MSLTILTPPTAEPVTLDDLKAHLRITHTDEDGLISVLGVAARQAVEGRASIALMAQSWRLTLDQPPCRSSDALPGATIILPIAPVISIDSVTVVNEAGDAIPVPANFFEAAAGAPARLHQAGPWPMPGQVLDGVRIDFTAGHASASEIPETLKQAVRLLTAHFYENREAASQTRLNTMPAAVEALTAPFRRVSV